jgi:hypothetical protein
MWGSTVVLLSVWSVVFIGNHHRTLSNEFRVLHEEP